MNEKADTEELKGRFAPSPSGRMHAGNILTALVSWLSVKAKGGKWILRIEDLDPQRSKPEFAKRIEDDLNWLGLDYDEGGLDDCGPSAPYVQSRRFRFYEDALSRINNLGLTYLCNCKRSDLLSTQAPHASDGRPIYSGKCRPSSMPPFPVLDANRNGSIRLFVPDEEIRFTDRLYGPQSINLARECGDFILRRADGAWAYQLAVVADDAAMGVTEIVRGADLLSSSAQQIYLYRLLGLTPPQYFHIPLLCNERGIRLSKRDNSLSMEHLRVSFSPRQIIGWLATIVGLLPLPGSKTDSMHLSPADCMEASAPDLLHIFDSALIPSRPEIRISL